MSDKHHFFLGGKKARSCIIGFTCASAGRSYLARCTCCQIWKKGRAVDNLDRNLISEIWLKAILEPHTKVVGRDICLEENLKDLWKLNFSMNFSAKETPLDWKYMVKVNATLITIMKRPTWPCYQEHPRQDSRVQSVENFENIQIGELSISIAQYYISLLSGLGNIA